MKTLCQTAGFKVVQIFALFLAIFWAANAWAAPWSYIRNNFDGSQTLTGHVPHEIFNHAYTYKYPANITLNAQVILPLQNQAQLTSLLQGLYNPQSPNFHHFLTPGQFDQQFGASAVDSAAVQAFLKKGGISVTGQSANGAVLYVSGPVQAFEHAFGIHVNYYQRQDGPMFFAPDTDPTLPPSLAGKILAIGGLDNLPKYHAHAHPLAAQPKASGTGPGGFLAPSDVEKAYNFNIPSTGTGQNIALFELDGYSLNDINAYEAYFGIPNVPLQNILLDGFNGTPNFGANGGAAEVDLDIELAAAFAPGSHSILVYEAPNTMQAWMDEWTKIASDDTAKVVSCSWGEPELDSPTLSFDSMIFQQMAAQGQAVFAASGDSGAFDMGGSFPVVDEPASQPYVTGVGISILKTDTTGTYSSESASVYGGGGVSAVYSIPSYQLPMAGQAAQAAMVSTSMRNVPDVVLTADASTAYAFYINGSWAGYYGSSLSTPIWASFTSRVNQGLGTNGPIGFINPAIYALASTASYGNDFHDITTGNNGYYPAEAGFDDATGLGSFNGLDLYNDLVNHTVAVAPPAAPTGLKAVAGINQVSLSWTPSAGALSYIVERSATNGGPYTMLSAGILNTTYTDTAVSGGTPYYYVVLAVNSAGTSPNSIQASATPLAPAPVAAPSNLTGSASHYWGQPSISLQWKQSTSPNIRYNNVYYAISNGAFSKLGTLRATTQVRVTGVTTGVTYNFYVTAVNSTGMESPASNKVAVLSK